MDQLIADFVSRMGLALPVLILVAVRSGQMIHQINSINMEIILTDVARDALQEKIVSQLSILLRVYRDTNTSESVTLPLSGVNLQEVAARSFFHNESIPWLNAIYLDLVNQGTNKLPLCPSSGVSAFVQFIR